ncbi:MAG: DUF2061 domain-containing protein [Pseudomonadota bacterium]
MEHPARTLVKALTWQASGLVAMSVIGFALTGSWSVGGQLALVSAATGFALFFLHERIWAGIAWGREGRRAHPPGGRFRLVSRGRRG